MPDHRQPRTLGEPEVDTRRHAMDATRTLAWYRRIGEGKCREGLSEACETKAALDTERQVLDELDRAARR